MADNFSQLAKDFIDRANGGTGPTGTWRLEVLQKRLSSNADGTPKDREIPVRIRRFLKGIPWAQVHDAIRYLISQSPYKGIIYNGVELVGKYRPTLTQWRRDDQEQVGGNAQGSYTLIQDLIEVTDDGDSLDTVSADSCSETEETTWVWDAPEIEKLPYDGSQGVTYAIRQVRRNEDGTFDYAIVRQVAKTKISGWKVTECDEYSKVRVRVFDNVYGGLYEGDPFTDGTTVLPIPAPCEADDGTLVQVSVAQNPDCTFRVTVQETAAKQNVEKSSETRKGLRGVVTSETTVATYPLPETDLRLGEQVRNELRPDGLYDVTHVTVATEDVGDIGSSCGRTVFEHQHAETRNEASMPEDEADFAGGGKTYQVQSRATEEGTWDVTRTETTEIERKGAQKTRQKTLRGVTETTVDRNVDNNDVTVTNIGDRVSVEMTPGGKYNRTVTKVSKEPVGDVGSNCETTVFEHRHVESENVPDRPDPEASSAGGGKTYQVQARATEEGTWDVTRTETTELAVTGAQRMKQKTLRGVTETTVDRNVDNSDVSVANIGDRVQVEQTPGGKWNRTVTKVSKDPVGDVGSNCETTVFEHRHVESENVPDRPEPEASSAGGGKTYQVQSRATEEGTWDVTRTETTEIAQTGAQKTKQKTLRGVTETTVDRNVDNNDVTVTNVGDRVSVEMTPGGKYNRTVTKVSKDPVGDVGSSCETTVFEHRHVESENVASRPEKEADFAGGGKTYQVQSRATEEGTWDVSRTTVEETKDVTAQHVMRKTLRGVTETKITRSTSDSSVRVSEIGDEVRVEQTPGGLWNRTETHASHEAVGTIGKSCSSTPVVHTDATVSNVPNGSQPEPFHQTAAVNVEKTVETRRTEEGTWDVTERSTVYQQDVITGLKAGSEAAEVEIEIGKNVVEKPTGDTGTVNVETSISASKNDHGSYDYQKRTTTYKPWGERKIAESENDSQRVEFHSFQNLTGVPAMTAGHGQSISASVSRNNVGSYDGSFRVVTGKPYGEEKIASADNDSQTVEFHAFQNLDAPPPMVAGQGESITASVSRNELGLFDGNYRKVVGKPYGEEKIATATNQSQDVEFHAFQNLDAPPPMNAGQGESISASVSRNELGLFDGNYRVTKAKGLPPTMVAEVNNAYRSTQIYQFQNLEKADVPSGGNGQQVTASANRNEFGLFDGKYTIETAQPFDSGWFTWDSKTVTASGTYWYHHGLRLFYNQERPLTDGMRGSNVSVSARMNEFGLFDGQLTYSDLYDWTEGGGSGGGGHVDGEVTVEQALVDPLGVAWKRNATVRVTKYWGKGNEASEASVAANQTLPQGLSLPARTYANGKVTYTKWEKA